MQTELTVNDLANLFLTDPMSELTKKRWVTQQNYRNLIKRILPVLGHYKLKDLTIRILKEAHACWSDGGKITMGHGIISMVRILIGYGAGILEDKDCQRIRGALSSVKFPNGKPRQTFLTAEQVAKICELAICDGALAIAAGHTIQGYGALRQKDIIGEYVPVNADPRPSNIVLGKFKWVGGIVADNLSADRILTHTTSKKNKTISIPLAGCALSEFEWAALPKSGPLIIDPRTGLPFRPWNYTKLWRKYADQAGVPRNVVNMDTRAGRITGLLASGVNPDDVRKFATHSQLSTTMGYSRGENEAIVRALDAVREQEAA